MLSEKKNPYVLTTDGRDVKRGSKEHVDDLQRRLRELETWRSRHPRGSENRALYSRLITKLRSELASALKLNVNESIEQQTYINDVEEMLKTTYGTLDDAVEIEPKVNELLNVAKELDVSVKAMNRANPDEKWVYHTMINKQFSQLRSLAVHCLGYEPVFKRPLD